MALPTFSITIPSGRVVHISAQNEKEARRIVAEIELVAPKLRSDITAEHIGMAADVSYSVISK